MYRKGFTLVELLIVMAILAILIMVAVGAFNPGAMVGRGNDTRRKRDLARISVSFEDYYNDNGCYPNQTMIDELMSQTNCNSGIFSPWMNSWPCDPESRQPYATVIETTDCPDWYKIYTNLNNHNDSDIPEGWYDNDDYYRVGQGTLSVNDTNYGTSSPNVSWYERELASWCGPEYLCYSCNQFGQSTLVVDGGICSGSNCYLSSDCQEECHVDSCETDKP